MYADDPATRRELDAIAAKVEKLKWACGILVAALVMTLSDLIGLSQHVPLFLGGVINVGAFCVALFAWVEWIG